MSEKETKIITYGEVDAEDLSEDDRRFFYISMLVHILELHREQKGKEVN